GAAWEHRAAAAIADRVAWRGVDLFRHAGVLAAARPSRPGCACIHPAHAAALGAVGRRRECGVDRLGATNDQGRTTKGERSGTSRYDLFVFGLWSLVYRHAAATRGHPSLGLHAAACIEQAPAVAVPPLWRGHARKAPAGRGCDNALGAG